MFRDATVLYPGSNPQLGRYCGPEYDIGPAMTSKILKSNGKYAYRSTLKRLSNHEKADPVHSCLRKEFGRREANKLGKKAKLDNFPDQEAIETPKNDLYEDEHEGGVDPIPDCDDLGNQHFDNYLGVQVLLPFGEDQHTDKVKHRKFEDNDNRMGQLHPNPILDTRVYNVEFPDGTEK